jgi:hypothetical protein
MRRVLSVAAMAGVLAACDDVGDSVDTVRVNGQISGALDGATAVLATGTCTVASASTAVSMAVVVAVASGIDPCGALQQGRRPANATIATLVLARGNVLGQPAPLAAGSYPVVAFDGTNPELLRARVDPATGDVRFAVVEAIRNGGSAGAGQGCATADRSLGTSGIVSVESVTPGGAIVGTVSASLQNGGGVSGPFTAPFCAVQAAVSPSCTPTLPPATSCE